MDRVSNMLKKTLLLISVAGGLTVIPITLQAGTILTATPGHHGGDEEYLESRFGSPPARVSNGLDPKFVGHQADEIDRGIPSRSSRNPASVGGSGGEGLDSANGDGAGSPIHSAHPVLGAAGLSYSVNDLGGASGDTSALNSSLAGKKGVQEVAVIAGDLGYFPKTVFVNPDVPVRLFVTGTSKNSLCIMMDSFQVRRQIHSAKIEEITFTPGQPGKFRFYCPINGMEGTMVVREPALASVVSETQSARQPAAATVGSTEEE